MSAHRAEGFDPPEDYDLDLPLEIDPLAPSRNIMEVFLLLLCVYTGFMLIFSERGLAQYSDIGPFFTWMWRLMLVGGPLTVFLGMVWKGRSYIANIQQEIGYIALATASAAFGAAAGEWITFVFAFFALGRAIQIAHGVEEVLPGTSIFHKMWMKLKGAWEAIWYER